MGEFFRGWRRKVGVVTLAMALVFMVGWVRGHYIDDIFCGGSGNGRSYYEFIFSREGVTWYWNASDDMDGGFGWTPGWGFYGFHRIPFDPFDRFVHPDADPMQFDFRWKWFGFDCARLHDIGLPAYHHIWLLVPYWSIVVPFTLLSAYLLLSKPRKSTSMKITELVPEKVA